MKHCIERVFSVLAKAIVLCSSLSILLLAPNLLYAQELVLKTGTTEPEKASVSITKTTDVAGHSCCVIAPPSLIEIFILEGDVVIRENLGGNSVPWLAFDPMAVDSNLEFIGQSRATVAGFSNILTVITGTIYQDRITGQITIGADDGLPTGAPLIHEFTFTPLTGTEFFITDIGVPELALQTALGGYSIAEVEVEDENGMPPGFSLSLDAGGQGGTDAEWWLVMLIGGELFSFDINTGLFMPGLTPTYQGPIVDIPEAVRFWEFDIPPGNDLTIFFGLDSILDSLVSEPSLIGTGFHYYF